MRGWGAKVDRNQSEIVADLRKMGYSVWLTFRLGSGDPDIVAGKNGRNWIFEVKPKGGKLTLDERAWHAAWLGQVNVIESTEDALRIMVESH